jgi:hypothetical protein
MMSTCGEIWRQPLLKGIRYTAFMIGYRHIRFGVYCQKQYVAAAAA